MQKTVVRSVKRQATMLQPRKNHMKSAVVVYQPPNVVSTYCA